MLQWLDRWLDQSLDRSAAKDLDECFWVATGQHYGATIEEGRRFRASGLPPRAWLASAIARIKPEI